MTRPILMALGLSVLTACGSTLTRLDMPTPEPRLSLQANVGSVVVRSVTLPTYAATEELGIEVSPGVIESDGDLLTADDPSRAVTLSLARQMDGILTAIVSPDPWPFPGLADVVVDVRVSEMLGSAVTGTFEMSGQYFIGGDAIDYRNSATSFSYSIPMITPDIPGAVSAQGLAVTRLAEDISRRLGR